MFTSTTGGAAPISAAAATAAASNLNLKANNNVSNSNNSNKKPTHRTQASTSSLRSSLEIVPYTPLSAQEVDDALVAHAHPYTGLLDPTDPESVVKADGVSFQPCGAVVSQDRYVVEQFEVGGEGGGGVWTLTGVFDGHLGTATVEHTAHHLPVIIQEFLAKEHARDPASLTSHPSTVANILKHAIASFDRDIVRDVAQLFCPPSSSGSNANLNASLDDGSSLENLTDSEIRAVINDYDEGLQNYKKVQLCLYGTTALVALVDPARENLWVANLGDCQAVLATRRPDNSWSSEFLTRSHNGSDEREVARVRSEHPGEPECIKHGRVLGAIAPFRCIGDHPFKLPAPFTRRVLFNLDAGRPGTVDNGASNANKAPWEQFLQRNRTPPYISAEAEVVHRRLVSSSSSSSSPDSTASASGSARRGSRNGNGSGSGIGMGMGRNEGKPINHFLILCTDGLADLYEDVRGKRDALAERYVAAVVDSSSYSSSSSTPSSPTTPHPKSLSSTSSPNTNPPPFNFSISENYALKLLRSALGGADLDAVSQLLTVQTDKAWVDDTTVVVQLL